MGSHYSTRMDCIDLFAEVIETVTWLLMVLQTFCLLQP